MNQLLRAVVFLFLGLPMICTRSANSQESVQLSGLTSVEFSDVDKGKELIGTRDAFMNRTQGFERQMRLHSQEPVSKEKYIKYLQSNVVPWKQEDIEVVTKVLDDLAKKLEGFDLPLPETVYLVRVTAETESNAPHCRGSAIIIPDGFIRPHKAMLGVMTHEMFHVLSSHNRGLRDKLYAIIGFARCNEIELPESLLDRRLTNPDAPSHEHYIKLQIDEVERAVVPITFTKDKIIDSRGLFEYIELKLMTVVEKDGQWQPLLIDGEPQLIRPAPDYMRQLGRNTGYIIHPEEALADNFAMLITGATGMPDPWVLEKIDAVLKE